MINAILKWRIRRLEYKIVFLEKRAWGISYDLPKAAKLRLKLSFLEEVLIRRKKKKFPNIVNIKPYLIRK